MKKEYDIFISYRREGGKEYARNLTSELVSRGFHPFLDYDELEDGKFDKRITDAIESAPVFLFILTPGALDRCVNEEDWVRKEILHAIKHHRHIVPVDIDKQFTSFPADKNFPQEIIDALGQYQFSQIQNETLYKESIDKMVRNRIKPAIEEYQKERQKAAGASGAEIHIETDMDCHVQRFHNGMYDVFISSKSEDYYLAEQISAFLRENGLNTFLASETLRTIGNTAYLDEIDQALEECNHLIVFCTKPEYAGSKYVKEEWQSFRNEKLSGRKSGNILTVVADTISVGQLPFGLRRYEVIKFSDYQHVLLNYLSDGYRESSNRNSEVKIKPRTEEEKKSCVFKVGNVEFKMIYVEGGKFKMGSDNGEKREKPVHDVTLSDYCIGETLVTQALWKAVMGNNPSRFKGDDLPVEKVSWNDCQEFIRRLNNCVQDQLKGHRFALPTEAQWEFAARGGKKSQGYIYSGGNTIDDVAWYEDNSSVRTHPVKQKRANELGLYDMSGNVWEWCQDWYGSYPSSPQTDPVGSSSGSGRVRRGGGWVIDARCCRSAFRYGYTPDRRSSYLGLRLVLLF